MSNYENAPATKMLAIYCACCARPLLDAKSVETGIGPVCRRKMKTAEQAADWPRVRVAMDRLMEAGVQLDGFAIAVTKEDARTAANTLVHRIAVEQEGPLVAELANVVRVLGFSKMADRIGKRVAVVTITRDGDTIAVKAPYLEEAVGAWRQTRAGAGFDRQTKAHKVPAANAAALLAMLQRYYPGAVVSGPKGIFTVEPARAAA